VRNSLARSLAAECSRTQARCRSRSRAAANRGGVPAGRVAAGCGGGAAVLSAGSLAAIEPCGKGACGLRGAPDPCSLSEVFRFVEQAPVPSPAG
jgi:hypothetical protein